MIEERRRREGGKGGAFWEDFRRLTVVEVAWVVWKVSDACHVRHYEHRRPRWMPGKSLEC